MANATGYRPRLTTNRFPRTSNERLRTTALLLSFVALFFPATSCHRTVHVAQVKETPAAPAHAPDIVVAPATLPFKFVAYGDIRFTEPGAVRDREVSDPYARQAIVRAIAEKKPAFVMINGDLVWRGGSSADWERWQLETKPLQDAKLPIFPVVGNHEYMSADVMQHARSEGLRNFFAAFPDIPNRPQAPWYSVQYSNCYFLMLDSEDDDSPQSAQMEWVRQQLDSLPATTDFLFIIMHRPPYTAATDGIHRPRASELALAKLLEDRQTAQARPQIIVVAGHVHNYERYVKHSVIYLVSGGGGAHPHPLTRREDDLYHPQQPNELEYHYGLFSVEAGKIKYEMYRLSDEKPEKFEVRDSFEVKLSGIR